MTETPPGGAPTVLRMLLARQLQALREKAGMTYEQAAEAIYSSPWTIRRMERPEGGLKPLTVKSLLMAYGITDVREIDAFLALARDAQQTRLVAQLRRRPAVLVPHRRRAGGIGRPDPRPTSRRSYPACCRPRAISGPSPQPASRRRPRKKPNGRVALRLARQHLLSRPDPPGYWVVLDETVLRRPIGGREVMREQIAHLIEAIQRPKVTVQVIPFAAGWHPALYGMFCIFRFPDRQLPDIVYSEALTGAFYLSKPEESARYTEALDRMCAQAALTRANCRDPPRHHEGDLRWTDIRNGMPAADLGGQGWRKPWSDNGGDCLEAKKLPGGRVALRQSSRPRQPRPRAGAQRDPRLHRRCQGRPRRRPAHLTRPTSRAPATDKRADISRTSSMPVKCPGRKGRTVLTATRPVAAPAARGPRLAQTGNGPPHHPGRPRRWRQSPCPASTACATTSAAGNAGTATSPNATSSTTAQPSVSRLASSAPHHRRRSEQRPRLPPR